MIKDRISPYPLRKPVFTDGPAPWKQPTNRISGQLFQRTQNAPDIIIDAQGPFPASLIGVAGKKPTLVRLKQTAMVLMAVGIDDHPDLHGFQGLHQFRNRMPAPAINQEALHPISGSEIEAPFPEGSGETEFPDRTRLLYLNHKAAPLFICILNLCFHFHNKFWKKVLLLW